jgi:hypothetical protein
MSAKRKQIKLFLRLLLLYVTTMTDLRDKVDWTETDIHIQQTRFLAHLALY